MADAPSAPSAGGTFKLMKLSLFVGCIALISLAEAEVDAKMQVDDNNSLNADAATADEAEAIQGKKNPPPEVPVFDTKPRRSSQMNFSRKPNAADQEWHPPMVLWPALAAMDKTKETTRRALQNSRDIVDAVSKMNAEYSAKVMEDKAFSPAFKEQITEIINFYTPSRRTLEQFEKAAESSGVFYTEEDLMLWPNLIDEETNTVSSSRMLDKSNAIVGSVNALNSQIEELDRQLAHMATFAYEHGYTGYEEDFANDERRSGMVGDWIKNYKVEDHSNQKLDDDGVRTLMNNLGDAGANKVTKLNLSGNPDLTRDALNILAKKRWGALTELDLSGDTGITEFSYINMNGEKFPVLEKLYARDHTAGATAQLVKSLLGKKNLLTKLDKIYVSKGQTEEIMDYKQIKNMLDDDQKEQARKMIIEE